MPPSLPFAKLSETNYDDWKLQMEAHLTKKNLFGVINGSEEEPTTGPNSNSMRSYRQKQSLTRAKLILGVDTSQLPHVREQDPTEIWRKLSQIHSTRGLGTLLTMHRSFFTMMMPANASIASWVVQVHHAAYRLEECYRLEQDDGNAAGTLSPRCITDLNKIMVLMSGLPHAYNSLMVHIAIILSNDLSFKDVVTCLLNEEQCQRPLLTISSNQSTSPSLDLSQDPIAAALMASQKPGSRAGHHDATSQSSQKPGVSIVCHKCGGVGHYHHQCPSRDAPNASTCRACGNQANTVTEDEANDTTTSANTVFEMDDTQGVVGSW
jgi:hypothetical protein